MAGPIYRFAPSPNGELHLGHAYSALFTAEAARKAGGTFLLRIEDIDSLRCRPHFTARIFEDLSWLGLSWPTPVRIQSEHLADYAKAQQRLGEMGVLYPCFCSRRQIASTATGLDPDGTPLYPGICRSIEPSERQRRIAAGQAFSLRIDVEKACHHLASSLVFHDLGTSSDIEVDPRRWGDVILMRKDIGTSYHIAVVVDDALQGITHITRGMDLFEATHIHRLLQALLRLPVPLYHHHPLIADDGGRKLSKSAADRSLRSLRETGVSPLTLRRTLGFSG